MFKREREREPTQDYKEFKMSIFYHFREKNTLVKVWNDKQQRDDILPRHKTI